MKFRRYSHWRDSKDNGTSKSMYYASSLKKRRFSMLFNFILDNKEDFFKHADVSKIKILDIGCSSGLGIKEARNIFSPLSDNILSFGVDINQEAIRLAKSRGLKKTQFDCSNITNLEYFKKYPDNFFDISYSVCALMHISSGHTLPIGVAKVLALEQSIEINRKNSDFLIKKKLIDEIVRVSKVCFFYESFALEGVISQVSSASEAQEDNFLTFDDYHVYNDSIKLLADHDSVSLFKCDTKADRIRLGFTGSNRKKMNTKALIYGTKRKPPRGKITSVDTSSGLAIFSNVNIDLDSNHTDKNQSKEIK